MAARLVPRTLAPTLAQAAEEFPAVLVTGPRQSGKTTLLRLVLGEEASYLALDLPEVQAAAAADPRGLLAHHPPPVILDEIQHAPGLLPYLREAIDAARGEAGRYFLIGSQNVLLLEKVSETLAGRTAVLHLLPLSWREIRGEPHRRAAWSLAESRRHHASMTPDELWSGMLRGGYPELWRGEDRDVRLWHDSYLQTYLERDVRTLRQVGDLTQFQLFLRALAARSGQLLNLSDLARELGIAVNTCKRWLSSLEASFQVTVVRPWHASVGKRLVKTPKVYFTDTGTLCHLVGLRDADHARSGPMGGVLLETAVLAEIRKVLLHAGDSRPICFWRTHDGHEVDFLVEDKGRLVPIEVKLTATPRPAQAESIRRLQRLLGDLLAPGYVVHTGTGSLPLGQNVEAIPLTCL